LTLYLDSTALFKRYVSEVGTELVAESLGKDAMWVTANVAFTELSINLPRRLDLPAVQVAAAQLERDWQRIRVVKVDDTLCRRAVVLGIDHALRTLDAIHLAAAERAGGPETTFLTFDIRLAAAARTMGFPVLGA
jgi:uncharacterized protein